MIALFFLLGIGLKGQDTLSMPKIGVALSGGGAKGIAHIGFLMALEEAGVEVDYLSGVSMGSIVGGMYASGYTPKMIASVFRKIDYDLLLSDAYPENLVDFDEKSFYRKQLLTLSFENGKFKSPGGLIHGQYISTLMDYYTWPVKRIKDFDSLPIPYRVIGTNIETCLPVNFSYGNISDIMRASMAVPLAFSPVEIEGELYVDGGAVRNIAVSELKEMGADIIIGSYTGGKMLKKEELNSAPFISAQLMSFSGLRDSEEQKKDLDLLVDYDFGVLNAMSFNSYDSLINLGYQTARKFLPQMKEIAKLKKHRHRSNKILAPQFEEIKIDSILVDGNKLHSDEMIIRALGIKDGIMLNPELMKEKMTYLYGQNLFDKISYHIDSDQGRDYLHVNCIEKPKNTFNFSIHYDNHSNFGINFYYVNRNLLLKNSRFSFESFIGKNYYFNTRYSLFFGADNHWTSAFGAKIKRDYIPAFYNEERFENFSSREYAVFYNLSYQWGTNTQFGAKIEYQNFDFIPEVRQPDYWEKMDFSNFTLSLIYNLNNLDHYYFPKKGSEIYTKLSNINLIDGEVLRSNYGAISKENLSAFPLFKNFKWVFKSRHYIPLHDQWSMSLRMNAILNTDNLSYENRYSLIGGSEAFDENAFTFVGFHNNEFMVNNAAGGGMGFHYRMGQNMHISVLADVYALTDYSTSKFQIHYGTGIQLGYDSIIGPVKLGFSRGFYSQRALFNDYKYYISVGYPM